MEIKPSYFITLKSDVLVKFENDNDEFEYFPGTIDKLHHYGVDEKGSYVTCDVKYEDGQKDAEAKFYDCDFENPESDYSWKFKNMSLIIKYLIDSHQELLELKERVDEIDDTAYESEDNDDPSPPQRDPDDEDSFSISRVIFNLIVVSMPFVAMFAMRDTLCAYK
mgnify:CR=1 FL=1